MDQTLYRIYSRGISGLIACAVAVYAAVEVGRAVPAVIAAQALFVALLVPAMVAARLATMKRAESSPRGALTFVLAGLLLLPHLQQ